MKLPCEITRDLLPLYAEHLTCPETNRLVEEHLSTCPACQEELHAIQLPMPVQPDPQPDAPLKKIRAALRRKGILTALLSILAVVCLFWLSAWMYTAQSPATAEQSGLWTYNRKENGANVCILEVQGDGVWLTMDTPFNWGKRISLSARYATVSRSSMLRWKGYSGAPHLQTASLSPIPSCSPLSAPTPRSTTVRVSPFMPTASTAPSSTAQRSNCTFIRGLSLWTLAHFTVSTSGMWFCSYKG